MRREDKKKGTHRMLFVFICIIAFIVSAVGSVALKNAMKANKAKDYTVNWTDDMGTIVTDLVYGDGEANKFDLYLPADTSKDSYKLVVYLHAGGFTSGDKSEDADILKWLTSKGYVACGINYTLFSEEHPDANIYTQSIEIRDAVPHVVEAAKEYGYDITEMAVSGGSAGGCLALLYAYRDAKESPVPVRMVFEAVGPSSFYPEDWSCFGFDLDTDDARESAAAMFSLMSGVTVTEDMFGTDEYDEAMKNISALLWVNENTVPTVMAYGAHDKMQSYEASIRLDAALTENNIPHEYIVCEHSGHALQNDTNQYLEYMAKIDEYLQKYLPVE